MARYINIKCPNCGNSLSGGLVPTSGIKFKLGVPFVRCSNCNRLVSTGKKSWSKMTDFERKEEIKKGIGQTIITSIMYSAIPIIAFVLWLGEKTAGEKTLLIFSISIPMGFILGYFKFWRKFKKMILEIDEIVENEDWDRYYTML